ncbi:hypothetical protein AB0B54_30190 [Microbispora bryophytorum]|uniref:hypothetical protein n=2 Tax=Microbispora bryophytorum TaxID=1460882 RepID=UPI0033F45F2C
MTISFDGTFYRVTDPEFEMVVPAWEGYEPDAADQADATITFRDGSRRYATFMTLDAIQQIMDKDARTGECLDGRYFWCSDLIVIRGVGFEGMVAAIRDLVSSGGIEGACGLLDPIDDDEGKSTPRESPGREWSG